MARRLRLCSVALASACIWLCLQAASQSFVGQNTQHGNLRGEVALQAEEKEKTAIAKFTEMKGLANAGMKGLVVQKEDIDKIQGIRDEWNNPPRVSLFGPTKDMAGEVDDWTLSTGASNAIEYITPISTTEDIQRYLSVSINFFGILGLFTIGGLLEWQRFFPGNLYW
eukprot:TRINITY_DN117_c0_g1_i9.p1 TRINITY_DN117_c0_g1~~TRINITY_DN117_c0_g1_i9.p1  ORF type:complete len:168 (-),score=33.09 TRINITY_DN117_c0_g1_i9:112-615(-)